MEVIYDDFSSGVVTKEIVTLSLFVLVRFKILVSL